MVDEASRAWGNPPRGRRRGLSLVTVTLVALGLLATPPARGQDHLGASLRVLDLDGALRLAATRSPSLAPAKAMVASVAPLREAADAPLAVPPRLEVSAGPRYIAGDDTVRPDVGVALWQDVPLRSRGAARERVAAATSRQASAGLSVSTADARVDAALAWVDARIARELVGHRRQALGDAETLAGIVEARVEAGAAEPMEQAMVRALVGTAEAELLRAQGRSTEAMAYLRHAVGLPPHARLRVTGGLELRLAPATEARAIAAARRSHPRLALAAPTVALAEAQADLALANAAPSISFGPAVTREGTGDWLVVAQLSLPLPVVEPGAFAAAQARRRGTVAMAQHERLVREVIRDVAITVHHRDHAAEERALLHEGAVAPAREAMRITRARYEAGVADLAKVITARRELLTAELRWLEATAELMRAEVELAHCTGMLKP